MEPGSRVGDGLGDVLVEELVGLVETLDGELELEGSGLELEIDVCGLVVIDEDVPSVVLCIAVSDAVLPSSIVYRKSYLGLAELRSLMVVPRTPPNTAAITTATRSKRSSQNRRRRSPNILPGGSSTCSPS
jgi:hypothetical protein